MASQRCGVTGDNVPIRRFDWEIRREISPGYFRSYAHGYWRDPFVVCVLGRVLWGKRALRRKWEPEIAESLQETSE